MPPKRLLISNVASRKKAILNALDPSEFEIHFDELKDADYGSFDRVIPLTLRDARMLDDRIQNGDSVLAERAIVAFTKVTNLTYDKLRFNRFLRNNFKEQVPAFRRRKLPRPFLLKKRKDSGGLNTFIIRNEQEELQFEELIQSNDYFCQEYTPGQVEYTAHFLFDGEILEGFTNVFKMNRDLFVRGDKMKPFTDVQVYSLPLEHGNLFERILGKIGFSGFGCFNYKLRNGKPQIFELNARLGGSANHDLARLFRALDRYRGRTSRTEAERRLDEIRENQTKSLNTGA